MDGLHIREGRMFKRAGIIAAAIAFIGVPVWYLATAPAVPESEILSRTGLHWHAKLRIFINGKKEQIPAGVGLGVTHNPLHTHDADDIIHLEFGGVVQKHDTELGKFFDVWNKPFSDNEIFAYQNGPDGTVKMSVNGAPNTEFRAYAMKDDDVIEIRYEK